MGVTNRKPHALRREKTIAMPRHVVFFDTETTMTESETGETIHKLKLGWGCYLRRSSHDRKEKREWQAFKSATCFWDFVFEHCQTKNRLWVIAHNLSFDFTVVDGFKFLYDRGFKCRFFYSSSGTTLIKVKAKGMSIMFVDSVNWFKESLETIGKRIGLPKLSVDFDNVGDSELSIYCRRDVEILVEIFLRLVEFLTVNRISRLCYTIGSTAMAAFLFRHYRETIYIHNNDRAIELERASYKGGRTECFFIGELSDGPYYVVDVNSLYPFIMQQYQFPIKYEHVLHDIPCSDLTGILADRSMVAEVVINTDRSAYAVKRDRTIFPVGRFTTTLTTPELLYAIDNGDIESIPHAVTYTHSNIFSSYVKRFYKLRQECEESDKPLFEHFCKLLLNSLYGKFGQKIEQWTKIGDCPGETNRIEDVIDAVTHRRKRLRYLLGEVSEVTGHVESRHSFPAIASHVTAYARMYMFEIMQAAGWGNYYYCDTDSLFVNSTGLENLADYMSDTELGKLKVESQTDTIKIFGLKDYSIDSKTVIKGIRKSAVRISDVDYKQEQWPSLQGMLNRSETTQYKTHLQTKHLTREYTKGTISVSGWVLPFEIPDESDCFDLPF